MLVGLNRCQLHLSYPCCEWFPLFHYSTGCEDHWLEGGVVLWSAVCRQGWVPHLVEAEQEGVCGFAVNASILYE